MKRTSQAMRSLVVASTAALVIGIGAGYAASGPGIELVRDQPAREAGLAMAAQMQRLIGADSSDSLAVARIYYLAGEQAKAEAIIERFMRKPDSDDLQFVGEIYAEAGEAARADAIFQRVIAAEPKDDWGQIEMAAWYLRLGLRTQGEALIEKALARSPERAKHYLRAGEGYLGVPKSP